MVGKICVSISPAQSSRVYAFIEADGGEGGIYRSDDGGSTWERTHTDPGKMEIPNSYNYITADTQDPDVVYIQPIVGLLKSTDAGQTFAEVPMQNWDPHALWIDPNNSRRMIEGGDGGASVTLNGGESWSNLNNQPTADLLSLAVDDQEPYWVYVAQNDNFGLSKNASATQRSPISIDAIEALTVNVAPYDVTFGAFIGGNINIVTKSGTNEFEGSVYAFRTDDSFTGNKSEGADLGIGDFDEETFGFTFGGPIIKEKLFFFVNYEKFETTRPSNSQTIDNIVGVTQADVDRVIGIFQNEYGFDPGIFDASDVDEDEKFLVKLDWDINDEHRASFTYQRAEGDVLFDDFPDLAVLQTNRYNINEKLDAYSIQFFSNWTDALLSTEIKIGSKTVENRQVSIDSSTPDFFILTPGFGVITAGGDRFRHNNLLDNESDQLRLKADYMIGDHVITAGL